MINPNTLTDRFQGILLGTAVGDALGLPTEGLSARRANRWFGDDLRHRFILGRGMISDDTEHTIFVAQSLLRHPESRIDFAKRLAWCMRWWLVSLPAGVGFATLRSILKLWIGFPAHRSGVFSAGNGPAMRAAPIGARFFDQPKKIDAYVTTSTRLTHTDVRAEIGARAVAHLTAMSVTLSPGDRPSLPLVSDTLRGIAPQHDEWLGLMSDIERAFQEGLSVGEFARSIGATSGVSGFVFQTVPVVIYSWLRHFGSFRDSVESVIRCGGDTDTTGAIIGALAGATAGASGIPRDWIDGIVDWPRGPTLLRALGRQLAASLASGKSAPPVRYAWPAVLPRNAAFLFLVLGHGFRRLLPPY